jgi:hypothetical protein
MCPALGQMPKPPIFGQGPGPDVGEHQWSATRPHSSSTGARTFQVLTIQNNAVVGATTVAVTGANISVVPSAR